MAKEEGFDTWWEALYAHHWWRPLTDIDKSTLQNRHPEQRMDADFETLLHHPLNELGHSISSST